MHSPRDRAHWSAELCAVASPAECCSLDGRRSTVACCNWMQLAASTRRLWAREALPGCLDCQRRSRVSSERTRVSSPPSLRTGQRLCHRDAVKPAQFCSDTFFGGMHQFRMLRAQVMHACPSFAARKRVCALFCHRLRRNLQLVM